MKNSSTKMSTLIAVGGGLAALPAAALELGEAQVNSSLGQPLRASIAYALAPNETLLDSCVSLQGASPQSVMPAVGPASITVANGVISIAGKTAIREPLVTMRVNVRCAYTANLSREYMLFMDPAGTPVQATATQTVAAPVASQAAAIAPPPIATRRRPAVIAPVIIGERHRVQPNETLSEIAQGIVDRPIGLWAAVDVIFDANPDAFIDDDPNKLKAGAWLVIPDFAGSAAPTVANETVAAASETAPAATAYPGLDAEIPAASPVEEVAEGSEVEELVEDNPYVTPVASNGETVVSIPDTTLDSPTVTSSSPNVPTASIQPTVVEETSTNWLLWLVGSGVALLGALLFFGRLLRERFSSTPIAAVAAPLRRQSDGETQMIEAVSEIEVEVEVEEPSSTQENLTLDADLIVGTGLQESNDVDVAQDFGIATGTELDMELPEELSIGAPDLSSRTDFFPPLDVEMGSILGSEEFPEDEDIDDDDDDDMSVIVDATQRDLAAIPVETSDETLISGDYTVSHEVDYKTLEQDYEDEFSATQALNTEIIRAAAELTAQMDKEIGNEEDTKEMSLASVIELDVTAQLPTRNDDISDLDDTGINEVTVNKQDADGTVEMPADDSTVEMLVKKGKSA